MDSTSVTASKIERENYMRKKLPPEEYPIRAKKREVKKRPRMKVSGASLKRIKHQGGAILKHS